MQVAGSPYKYPRIDSGLELIQIGRDRERGVPDKYTMHQRRRIDADQAQHSASRINCPGKEAMPCESCDTQMNPHDGTNGLGWADISLSLSILLMKD